MFSLISCPRFIVDLVVGACLLCAMHPEAQAADGKLKVCLVSGSKEYKSNESLAEFQTFLESHYPVECSRAFWKSASDLPGLEALDTCDVMLLFTKRLTIPEGQLKRVKNYVQAGKPIVGVRTASHAFQDWLILDKEFLGGNYKGHYGADITTQLSVPDMAKNHPVLAGVNLTNSPSKLYKNTGLAADSQILFMGAIPDHTEPVAWVREHNGARIFYTSLGGPEDFQNADYRRLLLNALFWTTRRAVPDSKK